MSQENNAISKTIFKTNIPGDWKVSLLDSLTKRGSGHTPDKEFDEYYDGGIKWISLADSYRLDKGLIFETDNEISELGIKKSSAVLHPTGTVLMSRDAGVGKSAVMGIDMAVSQHFIVWRCKEELNNWFLYYWLQYKKEYFERQAVGSTIKTIGLPLFKKLTILHPKYSEQLAIAHILCLMDTAINKNNQLIAQKELQKKWLMKNLLTGRKRLKGFGGEWKGVRFGDVTTNFSRRNKNLIDAKIYSVTNKNGFVLQSDHFEREIAGDDLSNYKIIKKNEFAYNPARINVGSIAFFEGEIGVISSLYVCFSTREDILDYYLLQLLQLEHTKHRIVSLGEGGVRVYLWYDLIAKIKINLPSIKEQTAIAQVLQAADKEIQLLKTKSEKLQEQKKGMMQVLLTGKKRLKIN